MDNFTYYYEGCIQELMRRGYDYSTAKQVVEYAPLTSRVRSKDNLGEYADTDVSEWVDEIIGKGGHNDH
jgi:hypothetical protein